MNIFEKKSTVYTAQSKHYFHARMLVCKYVLEHDAVPFNPFNLWGYFLYELVDRDLVRRGNNNVIMAVDEIWVFGPIADGVLEEIEFAMKLKKRIKYFTIGSSFDKIQQIPINEVQFEEKILKNADNSEESLRAKLELYQME
jgi:hypothetical protein